MFGLKVFRGGIVVRTNRFGAMAEWTLADIAFLGETVSISWTDGSGRAHQEEWPMKSVVRYWALS